MNQLCNQGTTTQVVQCFFANGNWPTQTQQPGLHFIHGFPDTTVGNAPPQVEERVAHATTAATPRPTSTQEPINGCSAQVHVKVDLGDVMEDPRPTRPRRPSKRERPEMSR